MKTWQFPVAIQRETPSLVDSLTRWAIGHQLIDPDRELHLIQQEKVLWFAGYLYPTLHAQTLEKVMRFFFCLFRLDDLLDRVAYQDSWAFLDGLYSGNLSFLNQRSPFFHWESVLGEVLVSLESLGNPEWKISFQAIWKAYLDAQIWELDNKKRGVYPDLGEYKQRRLDSSGVYLALHLLKSSWGELPGMTGYLEERVARFICLSNDLKSLDKEIQCRDFHNELYLLHYFTGCSMDQIKGFVLKELTGMLSQMQAMREVYESKGGDPEWGEKLFLLVGGCMYWSEEDTLRYDTTVNGIEKI